MKYVANAFGHESQVRGLAPDEKIERHVEELAARIRGGGAAIGDPDVGLLPQVGAPLGVVLQQLLPEAADDGGVEGVDVVRGRGEAHLKVGEVEDEVLPLVADAVRLEPEEEGQPVEEVVVGPPRREGRPPEVADGAEGGGGGADLGEAEGGVVGEEVVDGDYVVDLLLAAAAAVGGAAGPGRRRRGRRRRGALPEAHGVGRAGGEGECDGRDTAGGGGGGSGDRAFPAGGVAGVLLLEALE